MIKLVDKHELLTRTVNHLISDLYQSLDPDKEDFMQRRVVDGVIKFSKKKRLNNGPINLLKEARDEIKGLDNSKKVNEVLFRYYNDVLRLFISMDEDKYCSKVLSNSKNVVSDFEELNFHKRLKLNYELYPIIDEINKEIELDRETSLNPSKNIKTIKSSMDNLSEDVSDTLFSEFKELIEFIMVFEGKNKAKKFLSKYKELNNNFEFIKGYNKLEKFYNSFYQVFLTSNHYPFVEQTFGVSRGNELIGYFENWSKIHLTPDKYKIECSVEGKREYENVEIREDRVIEIELSKDLDSYLKEYEDITIDFKTKSFEFFKNLFRL